MQCRPPFKMSNTCLHPELSVTEYLGYLFVESASHQGQGALLAMLSSQRCLHLRALEWVHLLLAHVTCSQITTLFQIFSLSFFI